MEISSPTVPPPSSIQEFLLQKGFRIVNYYQVKRSILYIRVQTLLGNICIIDVKNQPRISGVKSQDVIVLEKAKSTEISAIELVRYTSCFGDLSFGMFCEYKRDVQIFERGKQEVEELLFSVPQNPKNPSTLYVYPIVKFDAIVTNPAQSNIDVLNIMACCRQISIEFDLKKYKMVSDSISEVSNLLLRNKDLHLDLRSRWFDTFVAPQSPFFTPLLERINASKPLPEDWEEKSDFISDITSQEKVFQDLRGKIDQINSSVTDAKKMLLNFKMDMYIRIRRAYNTGELSNQKFNLQQWGLPKEIDEISYDELISRFDLTPFSDNEMVAALSQVIESLPQKEREEAMETLLQKDREAASKSKKLKLPVPTPAAPAAPANKGTITSFFAPAAKATKPAEPKSPEYMATSPTTPPPESSEDEDEEDKEWQDEEGDEDNEPNF